MIEIGVFHNGASDLPVVRTPAAYAINDGNLAEVHESNQRGWSSQVRQGILADKLGFNYFFMTEHHFQPEGAEFSPNPLLAETAIAARTQQIRLGQAANIVTWWHPMRIAEQAAMLDVISGGRLEFGIGRGYQPREAEVFGWPFATIQDQERNRAYYQEAYEIILKGVDAAVVLASWAVLHDSAGVHALEPSADDRVLSNPARRAASSKKC